MAEGIRLEERTSRRVLWAVAAVVVLLLVWLAIELTDRDADEVEPVAPLAEVDAVPPLVAPIDLEPVAGDGPPAALARYEETCTGDFPAEAAALRQRVAGCTDRLAALFEAAAEVDEVGDAEVEAALESIRGDVEQLATGTASDAAVSAAAARAVDELVDLIGLVRERGILGPGTEAGDAVAAAAGVVADKPLVDQRPALEEFFRAGGDVARLVAGS